MQKRLSKIEVQLRGTSFTRRRQFSCKQKGFK